jgi:hypothetical protein
MRDLQRLAGGAMDLALSVFFCKGSDPSELVDSKNPCRRPEADGTIIRVPFGDYTAFHVNANISLHRTSTVEGSGN